MTDTPLEFSEQRIKNKAGEMLVIRQIYTVIGYKYYVVDSEDTRIFDFLADKMRNVHGFLNFIEGRSILTEAEFFELIHRFEFDFPTPHI
jgi:hypothetical protein